MGTRQVDYSRQTRQRTGTSTQTFAGVDGCKNGWVVVTIPRDGAPSFGTGSLATDVNELLGLTEHCECTVIDVPIGLPDVAEPGGREADRLARRLLTPRGSSVYAAPPRAVLRATSYDDAKRLAIEHSAHRKTLSKQAFGILPKIKAIDAVMTPERQATMVEGHPELSFFEMNGGALPKDTKHTAVGLVHRMRLIEAAGLGEVLENCAQAVGKAAKMDDVLDAVALAWTARRVAEGQAMRIPDDRPVDGRGLRMEMWR